MNPTSELSLTLRAPDRFFIDGQWVQPSTQAMFDVIQPTTEELFLRVAEATAEDMDLAITAARRAFDEGPWPRMKAEERAEYVRALDQGLRDRAGEIAFGHTSEMGVLHAVA